MIMMQERQLLCKATDCANSGSPSSTNRRRRTYRFVTGYCSYRTHGFFAACALWLVMCSFFIDGVAASRDREELKCLAQFAEADINGDNEIDESEYFLAVNSLQSDGLFHDVSAFGGLPVVLQDTFFALACRQCITEDDKDNLSCCEGHNARINILGARAGQLASVSQELYLQDVCSETHSAIDASSPVSAPRMAPVGAPSKHLRIATTRQIQEASPPVGVSPTTDTVPSDSSRAITLPQCFAAMSLSDTNRDNLMNETEYVIFVRILSDDFWPVRSFEDLPLVLRLNFADLAENGVINIYGIRPGVDPGPEQDAYLEQVCEQTDRVIDLAINPEPTVSPTDEPTVSPSVGEPETDEPTVSPSVGEPETPSPADEPTVSPSGGEPDEPTLSPTIAPTTEETPSPSVDGTMTQSPTGDDATTEPTAAPSLPETSSPTIAPTTSPTAEETPPEQASPSPTATPSLAPSIDDGSTLSPSQLPSEAPSSPTTQPSMMPSGTFSGKVEIFSAFVISNTIGLSAEDLSSGAYHDQLREAYDKTARGVVEISENFGRTRMLRRNGGKQQQIAEKMVVSRRRERRRLVVEYETDSGTLDNITDAECPQETPSESVCQNVFASYTLDVMNEDEDTVRERYTNATLAAIDNGVLQNNLDEINPNNPISVEQAGTIDTNPAPTPTPDGGGSGGDDGLSDGAIAGIVIFSVAVVGLASYFAVRGTKDLPRIKKAFQPRDKQLKSVPPDALVELVDDDDMEDRLAQFKKTPSEMTQGQLTNYSDGDYNHSPISADSSEYSEQAETQYGKDHEAHRFHGDAEQAYTSSSSNEGSSGWSSDDRLSDEEFFKERSGSGDAGVAAAAAVGVAGAAAVVAAAGRETDEGSDSQEDDSSVPQTPEQNDREMSGSGAITPEPTETEVASIPFTPISPDDSYSAFTSGDDSTAEYGYSPIRGGQQTSSTPTEEPINTTLAMPQDVPKESNDNSGGAVAGVVAGAAVGAVAVGAVAAGVMSSKRKDDEDEEMSESEESKSESESESEPGSEILPERQRPKDFSMGSSKDSGGAAEGAAAGAAVAAVAAGAVTAGVMSSKRKDEDEETSSSESESEMELGSESESGSDTSGSTAEETEEASKTPEEAARVATYRAQVEELVQSVVPDEVDNVDVMMVQFRGREAELVSTLQKMQQRSITQRARAAVHKSSKQPTRKSSGMTVGSGRSKGSTKTDERSRGGSTAGSAAIAAASVPRASTAGRPPMHPIPGRGESVTSDKDASSATSSLSALSGDPDSKKSRSLRSVSSDSEGELESISESDETGSFSEGEFGGSYSSGSSVSDSSVSEDSPNGRND